MRFQSLIIEPLHEISVIIYRATETDGGYAIAHAAIPVLFGVRAEDTADNTSIRVSWGWLCQGVLDFVGVHYQMREALR